MKFKFEDGFLIIMVLLFIVLIYVTGFFVGQAKLMIEIKNFNCMQLCQPEFYHDFVRFNDETEMCICDTKHVKLPRIFP